MISKAQKTSVIIVSYNGMQWIKECLASVSAYETIVVDNQSTDGTQAFIAANFPDVILLEQDKNLGFGLANNVGMTEALRRGATHFFLLNQDAKVTPTTISNLVAKQESQPEFGIVSPLHACWEGDELDSAFTTYITYHKNPKLLSHFLLDLPKEEIYEVPFVAAACWMVSLKCLDTVGGFDPIFFYQGEDTNYCDRLHYHGLKVGVVASEVVFHDTKNRKGTATPIYSEKYFQDKAYKNKRDYANINISDISVTLKKHTRVLKKVIVLNFLEGKMKNVKGATRELKQLRQTVKEVAASRARNTQPGRHYIS